MSILEKPHYITPEEYLEGEKLSPIKHEYIQGQVFAMSGVTKGHNKITLNAATELRSRLRDESCEVYLTDVKVRVEVANTFYYPDVVITCDEDVQFGDDSYIVYHPRVIIEVLSHSTEAFDQGDKFTHYSTLKSLEDYILVQQDRIGVDHYHRTNGDEWILTRYAAGDQIILSSLDVALPVDALYQRVRFDRPNAPPHSQTDTARSSPAQ